MADERNRRVALFLEVQDEHIQRNIGLGIDVGDDLGGRASILSATTGSVYSQPSMYGGLPTIPSYFDDSAPYTPGQSRWNSLYLQDGGGGHGGKRTSTQLSPIHGSPPSPVIEIREDLSSDELDVIDPDRMPIIPTEPPTPFFDAPSSSHGRLNNLPSPPRSAFSTSMKFTRSSLNASTTEEEEPEAEGWTTPVEEETKEMVWNAARIGLRRRVTEDHALLRSARAVGMVGIPESTVASSVVSRPADQTLPLSPSTKMASLPSPPIAISRTVSEGQLHLEPQEKKRRVKKVRTIEELVKTEQSYARDMVVVRDVFLARARGATASSIRETLDKNDPLSPDTIAEQDKDENGAQRIVPENGLKPMDAGDIRVIFKNIEEVVTLSSAFAVLLEKAQGTGDVEEEDFTDRIGEVFLEMIPRIQEVYSSYCSRHDRAIKRLEELLPALQTYFLDCRALSKSRTTAWDMSSLLIKPVQRCLKYPLLIDQILNLTPLTHPDYAALRKANEEILLVAEYINEVKRRQEIVTRIVNKKDSRGKHSRSAGTGSSGGFNVSKRIFRSGAKIKERMGMMELPPHETFDLLLDKFQADQEAVLRFLTETKNWSRSLLTSLHCQLDLLRSWQTVYAPFEGEAQVQGGGADVIANFVIIIQYIIEGPWKRLNNVIRTTLNDRCENLLNCFDNPRSVIDKRNRKLLDHSRYLQLKTKSDKNIDEQLVQDSKTYEALTAQLMDELPRFFGCVAKYFDAILQIFAAAQAVFFRESMQDLAAFAAHHCTILPKGLDVVEDHRTAHSPIEQAVMTLAESLILNSHRFRSASLSTSTSTASTSPARYRNGSLPNASFSGSLTMSPLYSLTERVPSSPQF
ncbi:hypothetical protein BT69DRAFT_680521 [Atractiella rhizophila]|nr:hypothetical protein BT69DRAFT_680521 [Atractiella rhizophila]